MGLASSQARLLNLTSRMHQIEYKAAKLEAEKLQMANESDRVYNEYLDALEKTKMQRKKLTTDGSVTYVDITNYADFLSAGFAFVYNNTIYNGTAPNTFAALKTALGITGSVDNGTLLTNIVQSGEVTIVSKKSDGTWPTATELHLYETSISTSTNLQEVKDESELRRAEAKYEADMRKIDNKERKYDADLATFDNERNAIKQEMDTLKSVAKENVERTFKIFS